MKGAFFLARRGENIYKRKDGRYEGRFIRGYRLGHKPVWGYVYGKQYYDVRKRLIQKKAEAADSPVMMKPLGSGSFEDWFNYWLDSVIKPRVKASTYACYRTVAEKHILPCYGKLPLARMTTGEADLMPERMEMSGLSASTCKSAYRLFRAAVQAAFAERLIAENPAQKRIFRKEKGHKARVLTVYEQRIVTRYATEKCDFPVLIALYAGLRIGEICALRWGDISWEERSLTVRASAQRINLHQKNSEKKTELVITKPKTEESLRTVYVPAFIVQQLQILFSQGQSNEFIFGDGDKPADPRLIQKHCSLMAQALGLTGVHFHTFRHSYATRLLEMGVDIKTVSALLGHSSVQTTLNFYAHSTPEHQRLAVVKLERFAI
jgi:integrase